MIPREGSPGPLVSVVIPTYNRANLLKRALDSVLRQDHLALEVIVVDDGSTDNTAEIMGAVDDTRVSYLTVEHGGAARARNAGIHAARGTFVAFQDTDDEWRPGFVSSLLSAAKVEGLRPVIAFCSHEVVMLDGSSTLVPNTWVRRPRRRLVRENVISTQTALVPRRVFDEGITFDEDLRRFQDWDLWLSVLEQDAADFVHVPLPLARLHRQADSISQGAESVRSASLQRIIGRHRSLFMRHPAALVRILIRTYFGPARGLLARLRSKQRKSRT